MFYITHRNGLTLAARPPEGQLLSPRFVTDDMFDAQDFMTWGEAREAAQNFGPDWNVEEIG